jgi:serine protease Do
VSPDLKDKYQLEGDQKGVVITEVAPGSTAADRGLKPGDVIVEVQQSEVTSPADVQKRVDAARKADRKFVLMLIQRPDGKQYLPLSLSKDKSKDRQPG